MRREAQNILLLLLGGALLKIAVTGDYLRYVKPAQQPWLLTAGGVTVVLAALSLVRDLVPTHHAAKPSAHGRGSWLLLLPVLAIFLVAPPALGADSVARAAGTRSPPTALAGDGLEDFPPLPRASPVDDTLSDFTTRAGWDRARALLGRPVRLTGFVAHQASAIYLARLVITCCAADAYPLKVQLTGTAIQALPDDTWIQATVVLVPGSATSANAWTPVVTVSSVHEVPQPEDPYEH